MAIKTCRILKKEIAIPALIFLVLGDLAASIFGQWWGKTNVLGRSLEGALASLIVCFLAGLFLINFTFINLSVKIIFLGALTATIVGHFPLPINDNIIIPLSSALVMHLLLTI